MSIVIGNIFGSLSTIFLALSVHKKSSKQMLKYQIMDSLCAILGCIFLGGYNGILTNIAALIRNILKVKNRLNKVNSIVIVVITAILGFVGYATKEKSLLAMLPVIAVVEYTIAICFCKKYSSIKIALLANEALWLVYLLSIKGYTQGILMLGLCINTIVSLCKNNEAYMGTSSR